MNKQENKRYKKIIVIICLICLILPSVVFAQSPSKADSTMLSIKITNLNIQKDNLMKTIRLEDAKRKKSIEGVSPEAMESINLKQDSICLELRSELTAIDLEIAELTNSVDANDMLKRFNELRQEKKDVDSFSLRKED